MFLGTFLRDSFQKLFIAFLSILPNDPIHGFVDTLHLNATWHKIMSFVNYFVPLNVLTTMLGVWMAVIATIQFLSIVLKKVSISDIFSGAE